MKLKKKTLDHDHDKYIATQEFNELRSETFAARLKEVDLANKKDIRDIVDFYEKLKSIDKIVTSNKSKHILVENELNELSEKVKLLSTKRYNFLLGRMYFTGDDGYHFSSAFAPILISLICDVIS